MAALDLEEQEQLSAIKGWWEENGKLITTTLLAASIGLAGYQGWQWHVRSQASEASQLFAQVNKAAGEANVQRSRDAAGQVLEKFAGTAYADMAALVSAKAQVDGADLKNAQAQLQWAAEKGNDPVLRDLARLRLAAVQLDQQQYDDALKTLSATPDAAFAARYADLKGDVLFAQGKTAEAKAAYQSALDAMKAATGEPSPLKAVVEAKLDSLGGAR